MPIQGLRNFVADPRERLAWGLVRGGPDWPFFHLNLSARHRRGRLPIPADRRPLTAGVRAEAVEEVGIWCGPISPHFGHQIRDFGGRLVRSARLTDFPLVFSRRPRDDHEPPPLFWEILDALEIERGRVRLIGKPTRFRALHVFPQDEWSGGRGPSPDYLDLLEASRPTIERQDIPVLYVSRSRMLDGRLAGEGYLDRTLSEAGVHVMRPEGMSVREQLALYRRARALVFSEGSAVHGLQLLGRVDADVVVLVRRPGRQLAKASVERRARSLAYWPVGRELIHALAASGKEMVDRALTVIDAARLSRGFAELGVDLAARWDAAEYRAACEADVARWARYMRGFDLHPGSPAAIRRSLDRAGLDVPIEAIWSGGDG